MDQFVTTYRKDYLWPYVRSLGHRPLPERPYSAGATPCQCHALKHPGPTSEQRTPYRPSALKEESWSRLGPMGPLLDPKVYPARVGPAPEDNTMRFNQPNVFLAKLQEKYPFIYECLRSAPPDDLISRINKDRLRTTYQVDFCKMMEYPSAPYDELVRAAGVAGETPCPKPVRLPGDPFRPNQRSIAFRPATITNMLQVKKDKSSCGGVSIAPAINTEYQDGISRLGGLIIKEQLFSQANKKRGPGGAS